MYLEQIRPPRAVEQRKDNHMGIKIGINGFGRIGRVVLRILADDPERFEVCGINLRKADVDYMVYLLKYDSVFRNFPGIVEHAGGDLIVNGRKIKVYSESDAAMINWADCGAEYIIESTGANNTTEKASRHFKGGAKKVIAAATHAVLSGPAIDRIRDSVIENVVLLDTIALPPEKRLDKFTVLTVAPVFSEAIERIYEDKPVSIMFV